MRIFKIRKLLLVVFLFNIITLLSAKNISKADSIIFRFDSTAALQTGSIIPIGLEFKFNNGKYRTTKGVLDGTINWNKFNVFVEGGSFEDGLLYVNSDYREINNHLCTIKIVYRKDTLISVQYNFLLKYNGYIEVDYTPEKGLSKKNKSNRILSPKIFGDGLDGKDGEDGENGINGDSVDVYVDIYYDKIIEDSLLVINIKNKTQISEEQFLLNPYEGEIKIIADGSAGGDGGDGGSGVDGKNASDSKFAIAGMGGNGGSGGNGGNGGKGGSVTIYSSTHAGHYLDRFIISTLGGEGGKGGFGGEEGFGGFSLTGEREDSH